MSDANLQALIASLPEMYQPVFRHPEFGQPPSRGCEDRLQRLSEVHDALQAFLGRTVRVLDLGCAQGYFSLSLAARGARAHGVDYLQANVDVCRALAAEFPELEATFECGRIENVIDALEDGAYDIVLGLSVFHHVVHEHGLEHAAHWLERLAAIGTFGMFELALASEPLYWAASLPSDERELLAGFGFVHRLQYFPTHLSDQCRPLYVCSASHWFLGGHIERFDAWKDESHAQARGSHEGTRRYYFSAGHIAKVFYLERGRDQLNVSEHANEVAFLANPPPGGLWPSLLAHGEGAGDIWLIREKFAGRLLAEALADGEAFDRRRVLADVLRQLVLLEQHGLFHGDLRTWNVLLGADGQACLIDYGSLSGVRSDCVWPGDLMLAFFIFVHDLVVHDTQQVQPIRAPFISPFNFPEPYRAWLAEAWGQPVAEWSFAAMKASFERTILHGNAVAAPREQSSQELWMQAMEQGLYDMGVHVRMEHETLRGLAPLPQELQAFRAQLERDALEIKDQVWRQSMEVRTQLQELQQALGLHVEDMRTQATGVSGMGVLIESRHAGLREALGDLQLAAREAAALRKELKVVMLDRAKPGDALREAHAHTARYDQLVSLREQLDRLSSQAAHGAASPMQPQPVQTPDGAVGAGHLPAAGQLKRGFKSMALRSLKMLAARPRLRSFAKAAIALLPARLEHHLRAFARHNVHKASGEAHFSVPLPPSPPSLDHLGEFSDIGRLVSRLELALQKWSAKEG